MYRTHTCGELRMENLNQTVTLAGWVQKVRNMGRDDLHRPARPVRHHAAGRRGALVRRVARNGLASGPRIRDPRDGPASSNGHPRTPRYPTGEIEVVLESLDVLNASLTPPFTIEDQSDGGDELRMKYRFLDLRRQSAPQRADAASPDGSRDT